MFSSKKILYKNEVWYYLDKPYDWLVVSQQVSNSVTEKDYSVTEKEWMKITAKWQCNVNENVQNEDKNIKNITNKE